MPGERNYAKRDVCPHSFVVPTNALRREPDRGDLLFDRLAPSCFALLIRIETHPDDVIVRKALRPKAQPHGLR